MRVDIESVIGRLNKLAREQERRSTFIISDLDRMVVVVERVGVS